MPESSVHPHYTICKVNSLEHGEKDEVVYEHCLYFITSNHASFTGIDILNLAKSGLSTVRTKSVLTVATCVHLLLFCFPLPLEPTLSYLWNLLYILAAADIYFRNHHYHNVTAIFIVCGCFCKDSSWASVCMCVWPTPTGKHIHLYKAILIAVEACIKIYIYIQSMFTCWHVVQCCLILVALITMLPSLGNENKSNCCGNFLHLIALNSVATWLTIGSC